MHETAAEQGTSGVTSEGTSERTLDGTTREGGNWLSGRSVVDFFDQALIAGVSVTQLIRNAALFTHSSIGREGGFAGVEELLEWKQVQLRRK